MIANGPELQKKIRVLEACLRVRSASSCQVPPSQISGKGDEKIPPSARTQLCETDPGFVHVDTVPPTAVCLGLPRLAWRLWLRHLL